MDGLGRLKNAREAIGDVDVLNTQVAKLRPKAQDGRSIRTLGHTVGHDLGPFLTERTRWRRQ